MRKQIVIGLGLLWTLGAGAETLSCPAQIGRPAQNLKLPVANETPRIFEGACTAPESSMPQDEIFAIFSIKTENGQTLTHWQIGVGDNLFPGGYDDNLKLYPPNRKANVTDDGCLEVEVTAGPPYHLFYYVAADSNSDDVIYISGNYIGATYCVLKEIPGAAATL